MTTEVIEERFVVTGTDQATANYSRMAAGLGDIAKNSAVAQAGIKATSAAAAATGAGFGNMANVAKGSAIAFGQLANAAQGMAPALEGVGAAVVRASGVIGALVSQIGVGGPVGIAIGAAVVGLGLLSDAYRDNAKEADAAARAAKKAADEFGNIGNAIAFFKNVRDPGAEFRKQNINELQDTIRALELRLSSPLTDKGLLDDIRRKLEAAKDAAAALSLATTDTTKSLEDLAGKGAKAPSGASSAPSGRERGVDRIERLTTGNALEADVARAKKQRELLENARNDIEQSQRAGEAARMKATSDLAIAEGKRRNDAAEFAHQQELKRIDEADARRVQSYADQRTMAAQTFGIISSGVAGMAAAAVRGEKITAKAMLVSIGSEIVGRGTGNLLDALFRAANPITAAATNAVGQIPLALKQIAIGGAMAGVGAALPGGGGGGASAGGGGGGSGGFSAPIIGKPSTETGNTRPIVYNINRYDSIIAPTEHDGMKVHEAEQQARRHGL